MWTGRAGLWLLVMGLSGCVGWSGASIAPQRYERALQLVDEGTSRLRERRLSEADAAFSAASELAPIPAALDGLGCVALLTGDFGRAKGLFLAALELDTSYVEASANLALLMDLSGHHERALALYNQYLSQVPDAGMARNNKAVLEYERGGGTIRAAQEMAKVALFSSHGVITRNREALSRELGRPHGISDQGAPRSIGVSDDREFATQVRVQ
jgi:tetratricopeptide (TPR) repeat protein